MVHVRFKGLCLFLCPLSPCSGTLRCGSKGHAGFPFVVIPLQAKLRVPFSFACWTPVGAETIWSNNHNHGCHCWLNCPALFITGSHSALPIITERRDYTPPHARKPRTLSCDTDHSQKRSQDAKARVPWSLACALYPYP